MDFKYVNWKGVEFKKCFQLWKGAIFRKLVETSKMKGAELKQHRVTWQMNSYEYSKYFFYFNWLFYEIFYFFASCEIASLASVKIQNNNHKKKWKRKTNWKWMHKAIVITNRLKRIRKVQYTVNMIIIKIVQ